MKKRRKIIPPPPRRRELTRREVLSFMASLAAASGKYREAEGYLLELLANLAFAEQDSETKYAAA